MGDVRRRGATYAEKHRRPRFGRAPGDQGAAAILRGDVRDTGGAAGGPTQDFLQSRAGCLDGRTRFLIEGLIVHQQLHIVHEQPVNKRQ